MHRAGREHSSNLCRVKVRCRRPRLQVANLESFMLGTILSGRERPVSGLGQFLSEGILCLLSSTHNCNPTFACEKEWMSPKRSRSMEPLYLRNSNWEDPKYLKRMNAQQSKVSKRRKHRSRLRYGEGGELARPSPAHGDLECDR